MLKVKLVHDYTKYNEKLEKGIEGIALETPEEGLTLLCTAPLNQDPCLLAVGK